MGVACARGSVELVCMPKRILPPARRRRRRVGRWAWWPWARPSPGVPAVGSGAARRLRRTPPLREVFRGALAECRAGRVWGSGLLRVDVSDIRAARRERLDRVAVPETHTPPREGLPRCRRDGAAGEAAVRAVQMPLPTHSLPARPVPPETEAAPPSARVHPRRRAPRAAAPRRRIAPRGRRGWQRIHMEHQPNAASGRKILCARRAGARAPDARCPFDWTAIIIS